MNCNKLLNLDFQGIADWYHELSYTWQRIYQSCYDKNSKKAFVWGCMLQHELNVIQSEYGLDDMDLLGVFDSKNLIPFNKQAEKLEKYIVSEINNHGVILTKFDTFKKFVAANLS